MIDNNEARKTWDALVNVAKQPLVKAIETEAYFEQFRGDDPEMIIVTFPPTTASIQMPMNEWRRQQLEKQKQCQHDWAYVDNRRMCYKCGLRER